MSQKKTTVDSPASDSKLYDKGNADQMPLKNYPYSSTLPTGKKTTIEGPCTEKCPEGYTK